MSIAYRIRAWEEVFESAESRKVLGPLKWVGVPTRHDGSGYKLVTKGKNAVNILCAWWAIVQVAAKMPARGLLANENGPFDASRLAIKTNLPQKIFEIAFDRLLDREINWLERVDWDEKSSFAENCQRLGIYLRPLADRSGRQRTTGRHSGQTNGTALPRKEPESPGAPVIPAGAPADNGATPRIPEASGARHPRGEERRGEEKREDKKIPPTVPQGGQESERISISNEDEAKRLICKLVLNGKDPARAWSHEAQAGLARNLPIPLKEIQLVGWFHRIPDDDSIQELRTRRKSEGTLMQNWSDEVTRAAAYRKKMGVGLPSESARKEPARWREFFEWKYREAGPVRLPEKFEQLPADQRKEWEAGREAFEREVVAKC